MNKNKFQFFFLVLHITYLRTPSLSLFALLPTFALLRFRNHVVVYSLVKKFNVEMMMVAIRVLSQITQSIALLQQPLASRHVRTSRAQSRV